MCFLEAAEVAPCRAEWAEWAQQEGEERERYVQRIRDTFCFQDAHLPPELVSKVYQDGTERSQRGAPPDRAVLPACSIVLQRCCSSVLCQCHLPSSLCSRNCMPAHSALSAPCLPQHAAALHALPHHHFFLIISDVRLAQAAAASAARPWSSGCPARALRRRPSWPSRARAASGTARPASAAACSSCSACGSRPSACCCSFCRGLLCFKMNTP